MAFWKTDIEIEYRPEPDDKPITVKIVLPSQMVAADTAEEATRAALNKAAELAVYPDLLDARYATVRVNASFDYV